MDMNKELKLLLKLQKKAEGGLVQGCGGGQSGCEHRIEVIVKMQKKKKKKKRLRWDPLWGWVGDGCRRIEVIVKMQEKKSEGEELAWVDVNEELKIEVREMLTKN